MKDINLIIWDMDGVHFKYGEAFDTQAYIASAKAASHLIKGMDFETAHKIAKTSHKKSHAAWKIFVENYSLKEKDVMNLFQEVIDISFMQPNKPLIEKMRRMDVEHCILTAGSAYWANRLVRHLKIDEFISNKNIFAQERCNHLSKAKSPEPFIITLDSTGYKPENALVVEDTQKNLKHAEHIGITTSLVYPKQDEAKEDYTQYVFDTPEAFADAFMAPPKIVPPYLN